MLKYVLQKGFWYILTFFFAVALNFALPRLGGSDPVDIIMGQAGKGKSPAEAQKMKTDLLVAFGMAELDDQGNAVFDTLRNEAGEAVFQKVPQKDAEGKVVTKEVPVLDAEGKPVMEERQKLDENGNPVFIEKKTAEKVAASAAPTPEKKSKKRSKKAEPAPKAKTVTKVEKVPVMETVAKVRQDTVMVDEAVMNTEPNRRPAISQFFAYIGKVLHGDLGKTIKGKDVSEVISSALPWTLLIQAPTILLGWIIGNLLGAFAAYKRGVFDKVFFPVAMFLNGVPYFVFGMLLVALFAITLGLFPAMGHMSPDIQEFSFSWECIKSVGWYYILPFFSCFPILLSGQATGMRSMSIYELGTDYMKYAKWLGLKEGKIIGYVFRNAMLPQLTGLAQSLGAMVGGALITEMIFSYPGLGMAMLDAINQQDYGTIQGCTLMISICVLVANFAVDVLIAIFDPRVKAGLQMGGK